MGLGGRGIILGHSAQATVMQKVFWEVISVLWSWLTQHELELAEISVPTTPHFYRKMYKQAEAERDSTLFTALSRDMKSQKKQINNSNLGVKENPLRLNMRKTVNQKVMRRENVFEIPFFRMNSVVHLQYFFQLLLLHTNPSKHFLYLTHS